MQLPGPMADLIVDLGLQPQDIRWPPEDPRVLFLYLAQHRRVDILQDLRIVKPFYVLPDD